MENKIKITGCDLVALVKAVYEESSPVGMGFLHYRKGPLLDEEAQKLIRLGSKFPVNLDYVLGRAVKFHVEMEGDDLYIRSPWFDHTPQQLANVLEAVGIKQMENSK